MKSWLTIFILLLSLTAIAAEQLPHEKAFAEYSAAFAERANADEILCTSKSLNFGMSDCAEVELKKFPVQCAALTRCHAAINTRNEEVRKARIEYFKALPQAKSAEEAEKNIKQAEDELEAEKLMLKSAFDSCEADQVTNSPCGINARFSKGLQKALGNYCTRVDICNTEVRDRQERVEAKKEKLEIRKSQKEDLEKRILAAKNMRPARKFDEVRGLDAIAQAGDGPLKLNGYSNGIAFNDRKSTTPCIFELGGVRMKPSYFNSDTKWRIGEVSTGKEIKFTGDGITEEEAEKLAGGKSLNSKQIKEKMNTYDPNADRAKCVAMANASAPERAEIRKGFKTCDSRTGDAALDEAFAKECIDACQNFLKTYAFRDSVSLKSEVGELKVYARNEWSLLSCLRDHGFQIPEVSDAPSAAPEQMPRPSAEAPGRK